MNRTPNFVLKPFYTNKKLGKFSFKAKRIVCSWIFKFYSKDNAKINEKFIDSDRLHGELTIVPRIYDRVEDFVKRA